MSDYRARSILFSLLTFPPVYTYVMDDNGKLDEILTFFFSAREAFFFCRCPGQRLGRCKKSKI